MELNSSAEETALHSAFVPDDGDQPDNSPARMFERSRLSERRDGKVHDSADASQAELDSPAGEPAQDPQRPLLERGFGLHERLHNTSKQSFRTLEDTYNRRHDRLTSIRYDGSSKRMELHHQLDNLHQDFQRLEDSFQAYMATANAGRSDGTKKKPRPRLKKLQQTAQLDFESLSGRFQRIKALSEDLRLHDRTMASSEAAQDNVCSAFFHQLHELDAMPHDDLADSKSLKSTEYFQSASSVDTDPSIAAELANYFTAFSRLRNESERIDDLLEERQEQKERRILLADQGQASDQTWEQFDRMWNEILNPAEEQYKDARAALEECRKVCNDAGIEIPAWADMDPEVRDQAISDLTIGDLMKQGSEAPRSPANIWTRDGEHRAASQASAIPVEQTLQVEESQESPSASSGHATASKITQWVENVEEVGLKPHKDVPLPLLAVPAVNASNILPFGDLNQPFEALSRSTSQVDHSQRNRAVSEQRRPASSNDASKQHDLDHSIWVLNPDVNELVP